jgi:hypothetical protein
MLEADAIKGKGGRPRKKAARSAHTDGAEEGNEHDDE